MQILIDLTTGCGFADSCQVHGENYSNAKRCAKLTDGQYECTWSLMNEWSVNTGKTDTNFESLNYILPNPCKINKFTKPSRIEIRSTWH